MTETTFTSPRLERVSGTPLGGVATGLARTTGTDVVLWRVLFVVLTFFGGLGAALYLVAYCAMPAEGAEQSLLERLLTGPDRRITTRQSLLLGLVLIITIAAFRNNGGLVFVAAVFGLGFLWFRHRYPGEVFDDGRPPSPPAPAAAPQGTTGAPTSAGTPAWAAAPAWEAPAPRTRSVLTPLTLSAAALVVGVLLMVAAGGAVSIPTEVVVASALGVVGLGLVASAFWGRARGLVPVAILLALGLAGTFAARPALDHGIGERNWAATTAGAYRLGIGHGIVTLPASAPDGGHVDVRVSLGRLTVRVPEGLHVVVNADVLNGDIEGFGVNENGRRSRHTFDLGPSSLPTLVVDAHVGAGLLEVRGA